MPRNFRFAIVSDLHIALPQTIHHAPNRFHLVEVSIPAFEFVLSQLELLDLDFLLLPGDLTQHGEPENHAWLVDRLFRLPYPVYVVPGNHDVVQRDRSDFNIGLMEFGHYYAKFGYDDPQQLYYCTEVLPDVHLIGLNSNSFDAQGKQLGWGHVDAEQLRWLEETLANLQNKFVIVMVHHNAIEHLPGQSTNSLGRRYMIDNAADLLAVLRSHHVRLIFTGHLHVQDVAEQNGVYDITTGSLVSYPHPYRLLHYQDGNLVIESGRVRSLPEWPDLQAVSRQWMADRSLPFMLKLLTEPPVNLSLAEAEPLTAQLRNFWADIANGDANFNFSNFPPAARAHFERFGAIEPIDNNCSIALHTT
ncbi:metallophosphoesterase [Microcoleus sp. FACHB-1515]|uniref:metallophosphoesterase family protein n=1 Tax=Cyanophyceae TaxID=3028117 RepID=UPI00168476F6|nr:metallophosphoesterase [Microcoleus sp. FACHB-1515]MBD2091929.1 metallophosphoesterase [Microcoleus sp. FACHB-1515]